MKNSAKQLEERYILALQGYLSGAGELALKQAYDLGRDAIDSGLGIINMGEIHKNAMIFLAHTAPNPQAYIRQSLTAEVFFGESLAAFEMVQRGFREKNISLRHLTETLEEEVMKRTTQLKTSSKKLHKAFRQIVETVTKLGEIRDPYTSGHERAVSALARSIAMNLSLTKAQIDGLHVATLLHDIGKIAVPIEILAKPGRINELELGLIKTHPRVGYEILKNISFPWPIGEIVLQSHEKINGSGYPQGLSGKEIMEEAKILVVADVVDAMSSHRPYRPALSIDKAIAEITTKRDVLYDAGVVDACLKVIKKRGYRVRKKAA